MENAQRQAADLYDRMLAYYHIWQAGGEDRDSAYIRFTVAAADLAELQQENPFIAKETNMNATVRPGDGRIVTGIVNQEV